MIKYTYPNGEIHLSDEKDCKIILYPNKRIVFCYNSSDADFAFDLFSEVGEIWKKEIEYIMERYNILIGIHDDEDGYYNVWEDLQNEENENETNPDSKKS